MADKHEGMTLIDNEVLAALYIQLSGTDHHTNTCATSIAPAETPGPCDCGKIRDLSQAALDAHKVKTQPALLEALKLALDLVSEERGWGTYQRMEGSYLYSEASAFKQAALAAVSAAESYPARAEEASDGE